ncbi:MAG: NAD(P)H-dependent glycerol-3-phosphate dehydrogenase [Pseudomonadota bacterium]
MANLSTTDASNGAFSPARPYHPVAVIGAGAWGTALAATLRRAGRDVRLWGRDRGVLDAINAEAENPSYLPGVALPPGIRATASLKTALAGAEAGIVVVPSGSIRTVLRQMSAHLPPGIPLAICAKGIEDGTGLLMTQVAEDTVPDHAMGVISGPTFARETALNHPTAATVAFPFAYKDRLNPNESAAARFAVTLSTEAFRTYISDDVVGVEVGGAVKNVIAIACGMMTGAGFAENTRAALITRGVDEMKALAEALGGRRETVTGLSGIGDLALTCSSTTSRNMSLGHQLGQGLARRACFEGRPVVVEGERNAKAVTDVARRVGVSMPIAEAVRAILHDGAPLGETFAAHWARPIEAEPRTMDLSFAHPATPGAVANLADRIS